MKFALVCVCSGSLLRCQSSLFVLPDICFLTKPSGHRSRKVFAGWSFVRCNFVVVLTRSSGFIYINTWNFASVLQRWASTPFLYLVKARKCFPEHCYKYIFLNIDGGLLTKRVQFPFSSCRTNSSQYTVDSLTSFQFLELLFPSNTVVSGNWLVTA